VRGALGRLPGVGEVAITKGDRNFKVAYDSKQVSVDAILKALADAGEPAKPAG
jgi:copper chaperone CopZ